MIPVLDLQVMGCWLGKAIGGTLGGPHEGKPGPLRLDFFDPVPEGLLPNDDLDLQVVWLEALLAKKATEVSSSSLARAWVDHVDFPFDEYGVGLRNCAYGINGLNCGSFDNWFSECMGAAIRSELWACLAPGQPARAAGFAWADAIFDHAGDGVWAPIFLAALQSAAFVEKDPDRLLDLSLDFLPSSSRVKQAVQLARTAWAKTNDWSGVRQAIHAEHGNDNFTDVAANLGYIVLGWLSGNGDFGHSICLAANCGADTDCTAATLAALLGILDPSGIPHHWRKPIGDKIVLSPQIRNLEPPSTLSDLTVRTLQLQESLRDFQPQIGAVLPRRTASSKESPISIPAYASGGSEALLAAAAPLPLAEESKVSLPGHWIRRTNDGFPHPVMLLRFTLRLAAMSRIRICAWSQTETTVWVNNIRGSQIYPDPSCQFTQLGAPSSHRGGRGHFALPQELPAGEHTLVVAWKRPVGEADLVVGIADWESKQWLPYALAEDRPSSIRASMK